MRCLWKVVGGGGLALYGLLGCGGSGGGGGAGLSGTVTAKTFTIPAGQTQTVTGDLTINASQGIEIDGTLAVPPGVNVALLSSGPIVIKGQISPASSKTARQTRTTRGDGTNQMVLCGGSGTSLGNISAPDQTSVLIAQDGGSSLTVGNVTAGNGLDSDTAGQPGGNGGTVAIGDSTSISAAQAAGATNPQKPASISGGNLTGGNGGHGYDDGTGVVQGNKVVLTGTAGGSGGSVILVCADSISVSGVTLGYGGRGGGCTKLLMSSATGVGQAGTSISATTGDGGSGGSLFAVAAGQTVNIGTTGGDGGSPGVPNILAQSGGPGGAGGDARAVIGNNLEEKNIPPGPYSVVAGNGGNSGDSSHTGGEGGDATLLNKAGGPIATLPNGGLSMQAGYGGNGYSGQCGASSQAGTNGGNGGNVNTGGAAYKLAAPSNGGNGGSGSPPGSGGSCGIDLTSDKPLGAYGSSGTPCSPIGATFKTSWLPGGNVSVCSYDPTSGQLFTSDAGSSTLFTTNVSSGSTGTSTLSWAINGVNGPFASSDTATRGRHRGAAVLYVSGDGGIFVVNEATGGQVATITVPNGPSYALAYDPTSGYLYAAVGAGIDVFDTNNSDNLITTISTVHTGWAMALNPSAHALYVDSYGTEQIALISTTSLTQTAITTLPDYPGAMTVNPTTGNVYATQYYTNKLVVLSGDLSQTLATVSVGSSPWGVSADSQRNRVYVANFNYSSSGAQAGSVTEVSGSTNQVVTTVTVGKSPKNLAVDEPNDLVYVCDSGDGTIDVLNGN